MERRRELVVNEETYFARGNMRCLKKREKDEGKNGGMGMRETELSGVRKVEKGNRLGGR